MTVARTRMTEQQFMRLPDDGRKYELVNGEPREVATSPEHDQIGVNLILLLGPHARGRGAMTMSQAGFRMTNGNIRVPDVSFTRRDRLPGGQPAKKFGAGAPDLCVEIISPSEDPVEMSQKLQEYFDSGAQIVWQVLPGLRRVQVFTSPTAVEVREAGEEIEAGDLLPGFRCRVDDIFDLN